jgi:hypothetical protein
MNTIPPFMTFQTNKGQCRRAAELRPARPLCAGHNFAAKVAAEPLKSGT